MHQLLQVMSTYIFGGMINYTEFSDFINYEGFPQRKGDVLLGCSFDVKALEDKFRIDVGKNLETVLLKLGNLHGLQNVVH